MNLLSQFSFILLKWTLPHLLFTQNFLTIKRFFFLQLIFPVIFSHSTILECKHRFVNLVPFLLFLGSIVHHILCHLFFFSSIHSWYIFYISISITIFLSIQGVNGSPLLLFPSWPSFALVIYSNMDPLCELLC